MLTPDDAAKRTMHELLAERAQAAPEQPAVIETRDDGDVALSWRDLYMNRVDRTATLLLDLGVRPGECVAFQLPNCLEFVIIALATLRIGAICCPLMPIFREREVAFCLCHARALSRAFAPDEARGRRHADEIAMLLRESQVSDADLPLHLEHVIVCAGGAIPYTLPAPEYNDHSVSWLRFTESAQRGASVEASSLASREPDCRALACNCSLPREPPANRKAFCTVTTC